MQNFDREGTFRGRIIGYGVQEAKESQSVAIACQVAVDEAYNFETELWEDWSSFDMGGYANIWVIGKKGNVLDKSVESLTKATGWGGTFQEVVEQTWSPTPCQFVVKANVYNNETTYQVAFLNPFDSTPGGGGIKSIDPSKVAALQGKYGGQLRALAANAKRNTSPPADKPSSPPPVGAGAGRASDIPF